MRKLKAHKSKQRSRNGRASSSPPIPLERDFDGFVHTRAGFLSAGAYNKIRAANPAAGLPPYEEIPTMGKSAG
jgi:hypothetical protein